MVERSLVDLDEDVSRVLPELKHLQILEKDDNTDDGFTLKTASGFVTLRQLLTHTSGIGYEFMNPLIQLWRKKFGPGPADLKGKVLATYSTPLVFEPGSSWQYGGGLDWAGIMVERLSKKSLGDYFDEHIFEPLGMTSTTFHLDQRPDIIARLVPHAVRGASGKLDEGTSPIYSHSVQEHSGGGGLWSSTPDYLKVLTDLISPTPTLLTAHTITTMLAAPQLSPDSPALATLGGARGGAVASNAAAVDVGINYGLGGMVLTKDSAVLPKGTCSWGGLPNLKWFFNRDLGVAGFYGSQVMPSGDRAALELSNAFFKEVMRLKGEMGKASGKESQDGLAFGELKDVVEAVGEVDLEEQRQVMSSD